MNYDVVICKYIVAEDRENKSYERKNQKRTIILIIIITQNDKLSSSRNAKKKNVH